MSVSYRRWCKNNGISIRRGSKRETAAAKEKHLSPARQICFALAFRVECIRYEEFFILRPSSIEQCFFCLNYTVAPPPRLLTRVANVNITKRRSKRWQTSASWWISKTSDDCRRRLFLKHSRFEYISRRCTFVSFLGHSSRLQTGITSLRCTTSLSVCSRGISKHNVCSLGLLQPRRSRWCRTPRLYTPTWTCTHQHLHSLRARAPFNLSALRTTISPANLLIMFSKYLRIRSMSSFSPVPVNSKGTTRCAISSADSIFLWIAVLFARTIGEILVWRVEIWNLILIR